jgi:hypothetical protein
MNNGRGPGAPANDNSALSLLVNAVDSRDGGRRDSGGGSNQGRSLAETLRLQGLGGDTGPSLEEQLLMYQQQQQQQQQQHAYGSHQAHQQAGGGLFSQLRDQRNMFSQLGQQQQLAQLLGLGQGGGGGGGGGGQSNDMRAALAAQLRQSQSQSQAPQFTQADLLALSRSGALQGILGGQGGQGGHGQGGGGGGANQYASEIEGMQRLEELERRQRLLAASKNAAGRPMEAEMSYRPEPVPEPRMPRPPEQKQYPPKPLAAPVATAEPAAAPIAETNKEEVEKAPGSVIVPCRARGMPMDHNFKVSSIDHVR